MSVLRVGVMGCSSFAQHAMMPALQECEEIDLICVASRSKDKLAEVVEKFGCEVVVGYDTLLERDDIDVIYMPLPTGLHEKWCCKALDANKHLLVEKSFAENYMSGKRLLNLAREKNLLVFENFQFQTHSQWRKIKSYMTSGELGDVKLLRCTFGFPALPKENFRWNKKLGGGALLDAGAYMIKASTLLLGAELELLGASLQMDTETGVDKYGEAMFRNKAGQVSQVSFGLDYFYQCRVELLGTKGKLSTNRVFTAPPGLEPVLLVEKQDSTEEIKLSADNHYVNMWNYFATEVQVGNYTKHWDILLEQLRLLDGIRTKSQG